MAGVVFSGTFIFSTPYISCIEALGSPAYTHAAGLATKRRMVSQPQYFRSNTPSLLAAVAARGRPWGSVGPFSAEGRIKGEAITPQAYEYEVDSDNEIQDSRDE